MTEGPGRGARIFLAVAVLIHLAFLVSLPTGFLDPLFVEASEGLGQASDFFGIYQAGANFAHGYSIYDSHDYRAEAPQSVPFYYFYRYLPPTAVVAAPAAVLLHPWTAYWVWVVICEGIVLSLALSTFRTRGAPAGRRWIAAALWLGFFPFYIEQVMGQFSIVMAAFLWMLWRFEGRGGAPGAQETPAAPRPTGSSLRGRGLVPASLEIVRRWRTYRWREDRVGSRPFAFAWIGSLVLKTFTVLLVFPYLRDGRLKRVLAGAVAALALSLPYFVFRPADLWEFLRLNLSPFTPSLHKGSFGLHNFLRAVTSDLFGGWGTGRIELAGIDGSIPGLIVLGILGIVFLTALVATVRLLDHPRRAAFDLALWTAAFFLIFKSIWEYHYVMLLPGLAAVYLVTGSRWVLGCAILLGLPSLYVFEHMATGLPSDAPVESWPEWFRLAHYAVKSLPTLVFFGFCLREAMVWAGRTRRAVVETGAGADTAPGGVAGTR